MGRLFNHISDMKRYGAFLLILIGAPVGAQSEQDAITIGQEERFAIEAEVKRSLKDPASANFRWLPSAAQDGAYCGLVNAKNSYGGYTGFQPYFAHIARMSYGLSVTILKIGSGGSASASIEKVCRKAGLNLERAE